MKIFRFRLITIFLLSLYACNPKENDFKGKRSPADKEVITTISDWIKKYSVYPESYVSRKFSFVETMKAYKKQDDGSLLEQPKKTSYAVWHEFDMKNKKGELEQFDAWFFLDYQFYITLIKAERGNTITGPTPADYKLFWKKFGRELSQLEKDTLRNKQQQKLINSNSDVLKAIENSNSEQLEELKEILKDSSMIRVKEMNVFNGYSLEE